MLKNDTLPHLPLLEFMLDFVDIELDLDYVNYSLFIFTIQTQLPKILFLSFFSVQLVTDSIMKEKNN